MKFEDEVIQYGKAEKLKEHPASIHKGKLYIISTPIGNDDDISVRALNLLKICDIVVCEELKEGAHLLKTYRLNKELIALNEQNEEQEVYKLINLIKDGKKLALISDAGTPIFADPGLKLLQAALRSNLNIEVAPGASSIMTALVRSGFDIDRFFFAGFLNRKSEQRLSELKQLKHFPYTTVLLETPYRLMAFLEAASSVMPEREVYIGMNLTMIYETHHYGTFKEIYEKLSKEKIKAEFVVVIKGDTNSLLELPKPLFAKQDKEYSRADSHEKRWGQTEQREFRKDSFKEKTFEKRRSTNKYGEKKDFKRKFGGNDFGFKGKSKFESPEKFSKSGDSPELGKSSRYEKFTKDRYEKKPFKNKEDNRNRKFDSRGKFGQSSFGNNKDEKKGFKDKNRKDGNDRPFRNTRKK